MLSRMYSQSARGSMQRSPDNPGNGGMQQFQGNNMSSQQSGGRMSSPRNSMANPSGGSMQQQPQQQQQQYQADTRSDGYN